MASEPTSADHWVYFGDGNAAQILDTREYIKRDSGIRYVKFILLPSRRIEQMYDIGDLQDDTGAIVREYKLTDVVFLERGVYRTRVWVYVDFMGGETPASRRTKELTDTLNDTDRLLRSAEAAKSRLIQELNMERQQKIQAIRVQSDILREVARARGRVDGEGDDISADTEG